MTRKKNFTYEELIPTSWNTLVKVPRNLIDVTAFPSLQESVYNETPAWQSEKTEMEDVVILSIGGFRRNGDVYLLPGARNVPWSKMTTFTKGEKLPALCNSHVGLLSSTLHIFGGYDETGKYKEGGSYTNLWSCDLLGQDRPLDHISDDDPFRMNVTYPNGNHYEGECAERAFIHNLEREEADNRGEDYISSEEEDEEMKVEEEEKVNDEESKENNNRIRATGQTGILDITSKKKIVEKRLRHGKGKMTYENGDKYSGSWYKGQKHGFGVLHFMNKEEQMNSILPKFNNEGARTLR